MKKQIPWLVVIVILGLFLRGYHYMRNPVIWHDEAALLINAVDKSFAEHWGALYFAEAAPPLFLTLIKVHALVWGESSFVLRLLPFLASCVAFVGLVVVARWILSTRAVLWFALLMACSDRLLWHCCEAKPYAVDVFVVALVIGLFLWFRRTQQQGVLLTPAPVRPRRPDFQVRLCGRAGLGSPAYGALLAQHSIIESAMKPPTPRELLIYTSLTPFLIFLSFPACFVLGGLVLALLPSLWKQRHWPMWGYFTLFLACLAVSFLVLLYGPIRAQHVGHLESQWHEFFAHWELPWLIPLELLKRWTEAARYACEPIGNVLFALAAVGGFVLWYSRQYSLFLLLVGTLAVTSVAWLAGRYPIGPTRVMVFATPVLLLLVALGGEALWQWCQKYRRLALVTTMLLLSIPVVYSGRRLLKPWNRADTYQALSLVQHQATEEETILGTSWEHIWYFRHWDQQFCTLVSGPHDPPVLCGADANFQMLKQRCWLLLRSTPTQAEHQALAQLRLGKEWLVRKRYPLRLVTVLYLERKQE